MNRPSLAHLRQAVPIYIKGLWSPTALVIMASLFLAIFLGYFSVIAGLFGGVRPTLMAALPAVILLGFVFLINKQALLVSIIFLRASMDPVLETTKIPLGNTSMGLGGVLNGLIILLVLFSFRAEHRPYMRKAGWLALPLF